jgi:hypothetical protein
MMKRSMILLVSVPLLFAAGCSSDKGSDTSTTGAGAAPTVTSTEAGTEPTATTEAPAPTSPGTISPAATSTATSASGGQAATTRCHTSDLTLKPGDGNGTAGTVYQALVFTNKSNKTCTLYGYPGVSWVTGNNGTQVADPFQRGGSTPKKTITLKAGQSAHANLQMPEPLNFDPSKCKPVSVRGLRVYPPDETAAVFVSLPSKQCSVKGVNVDTVWAISSGTAVDPS